MCVCTDLPVYTYEYIHVSVCVQECIVSLCMHVHLYVYVLIHAGSCVYL